MFQPVVILGSNAVGYRIKFRTPKDIDLLTNEETANQYLGFVKNREDINTSSKKMIYKIKDAPPIEIDITDWCTSSKDLYNLILEDPKTELVKETGLTYAYPSINVLYMLKMSHRYLKNSPHFLKTLRDIQYLRRMGAVIQPEHVEFYKKRMKITYDYKLPVLKNNTKDGFFTGDGVPYFVEHDQIHEVVTLLPQPAYKYYQTSNEQVDVSKSLFFAQPKVIQLLGGLEESLTLALERSQIPNGFKVSPKKSFDMALMKVCTSITSGWFREFCWENFDQINALYDDSYVERFKEAVRSGKVNKLMPFSVD